MKAFSRGSLGNEGFFKGVARGMNLWSSGLIRNEGIFNGVTGEWEYDQGV